VKFKVHGTVHFAWSGWCCIGLYLFIRVLYVLLFWAGVIYVEFLLFKKYWVRCTNMLSFFIVVVKYSRFGHLDNQGVSDG